MALIYETITGELEKLQVSFSRKLEKVDGHGRRVGGTWTNISCKSWTEIIRECQASGLTNKELCSQRGIAEKTYYY